MLSFVMYKDPARHKLEKRVLEGGAVLYGRRDTHGTLAHQCQGIKQVTRNM